MNKARGEVSSFLYLSTEGLFGEEVADDLESTESLLKDTKLELMLSCRLAAALLSWERNLWGKAHWAEDEVPSLGPQRPGKARSRSAQPHRTAIQGRKQMPAAMLHSCYPVGNSLLRILSRPLSCCQAAGLLGLLWVWSWRD